MLLSSEYVQMFLYERHCGGIMAEKTTLFVLNERAVPEVLLKVVEAKKLLETKKCASVQEATERVGISRSSFYKYKDDIKPFHEDTKGKTINLVIQLNDEPGILSRVLDEIAHFRVNVLTIHQSLPVGGFATLTLSVDVLEDSGNFSDLVSAIEQVEGVHYVKILARE